MTVAEPKPLIPAATAAAFIELAKARRSVYTLSASSPVPDSEIQELVKSAILHVPSSFNTQSTRLVLLLHEEHRKLWDAATKIFVESMVVPGKMSKEMWETHTKPRLQGFRAAYGTVRISSPLPFLSGYGVKELGLRKSWLTNLNRLHPYRFFSSKIRNTSRQWRRSFRHIEINLPLGHSIRMPCISISVRSLSPFSWLFF